MSCYYCPPGGADSPGSQVFPLHAAGRGDPQVDAGEESKGERIGLLREKRPLRLSADFTGGVFGQPLGMNIINVTFFHKA